MSGGQQDAQLAREKEREKTMQEERDGEKKWSALRL
jgi:hypothetical protein